MSAMDRNVGMGGAATDDLPRTLRREREARERAGQTGHAPGHGSGHASGHGSAYQASSSVSAAQAPSYVPEPTIHDGLTVSGNTVTDIRVPFFRMMLFCFKLVFAAVPALVLLGVLLWLAGHALMTYAPWLVKLQILIRVPG